MATKIKFSLFQLLFNLFSVLANRTNGWSIFVQPKLFFGTLILGLGITACNNAPKATAAPAPKGNDIETGTCYDTIRTDTVKSSSPTYIPPPDIPEATCYEVTPNDTISNEEMSEVRITPTCYEPAVPDCYKPVKSVPSDTVITEVIEVTTCYLPIYEPTEEDTIKPAPTDEEIPIEVINSVQPPTCYISLPPKSTNKSND